MGLFAYHDIYPSLVVYQFPRDVTMLSGLEFISVVEITGGRHKHEFLCTLTYQGKEYPKVPDKIWIDLVASASPALYINSSYTREEANVYFCTVDLVAEDNDEVLPTRVLMSRCFIPAGTELLDDYWIDY